MSLPETCPLDAQRGAPPAQYDPGDASPIALPPPRRIPNIGHAALFLGFAAMLFYLLQLTLAVLGLSPVGRGRAGQIAVAHPMLQIAALAATYGGTLGAAWLFFPLVWRRGFLAGLRWNWKAARLLAARLLGLGVALAVLTAMVTSLIAPPKQLPVDQFFPNAIAAWLMTVFGTLVAPAFEEIAFRGMLLPAFAISFDWLRMPRTPAGYAAWRSSDRVTLPAWIFSAVVTSGLFAMIHAQQVAHLWAAVGALFCVSLTLTMVRLKTESVAASTVVHAAYNGLIFLLTIIQTGAYRHLERMAH